ncbi:prepilin-type N-terminal cleavage/methylation domain-containing protein [Anaerostipes sp.]|uniref:prepilin-type N-terminal cleavage/methylation domain-containing protein n=1 Tax=Anaerostipes sp. TaxID=1872530 RepID=UPI0025C1EE08|nr:prepilin-type N-terminal cleavage/methylation domain-containing protein [Anaerostipes sp.]MBS7007547.1 prepilin-type N-terminal cleavage/methylation domain-containing protein [Anaerostipes sp.]
MAKHKQNIKGFTLVELIVVLLILAILLALLIPSLIGYITNAQKKACLVNKAGLLRDLTADEIYELEGAGKYDTAYLKSLAGKSEYKCRQGGPYDVSRGSDGSIVIICSKHDKDYNFNMNEALNYIMENDPDTAKLISSYMTKNIDSSSGTGKAYENLLNALGKAGFNAGQAGVNSWSFQGKGSSYYLYWTTEDITNKSPGDKVKVIRYNSARGTYTAGYVVIRRETLSGSDSSDGKPRTYNVLSRSDNDWQEYTGVKQSDDDKKNYSKIYQIFKNM